jgi:lysyl-tRNA synthetase class 2
VSEQPNFVQKARREKLDALLAAGVPAFAYEFDRSHLASEAVAAMPEADPDNADAAGPTVRVAGRLTTWRGHGKTAFAHLADGSGRIQLYFRKDELGEHVFGRLALFDIGDVVGIAGSLMRTRTGEVTVRVSAVEMLAKSLRPLPYGKEEVVDGQTIRHSGFADPEQRYRQLCGPRRAPRSPRAVHRAHSAHFLDPLLSRRSGISRGRDADPAALVWRCNGASVHDAPQRARHAALPAHRG